MVPAAHREQLVSMLCEAAEIEHCLMCSYLYAAFSLKQDQSEGLTATEMKCVAKWQASLVQIATDEMLHLALVNNLLISLGARPHYRRYNFPISGGLFPADITVVLAPLNEATLDHFVYLERPEDAEDSDGDVIEKINYRRTSVANRLMPFSEDYTTVGELYGSIEESFVKLVEQQGAEAVFLGSVGAQLTAKDFRLTGLHSIASLEDVRATVHLIRHQGEGSNASTPGSHYARFSAIRREWQELKSARPDFVPARPGARNPVMRSPLNAERIQIVLEPASQFVDLANAVYGLMIRLLALMSEETICSSGLKRVVGDQTLGLMHLLADIGLRLPSMPANDAYPGVTAGVTFTVSRNDLAFQSRETATLLLAERFEEIASKLEELAKYAPTLKRYAHALASFGLEWRAQGELQSSEAKSVTSDSTAPVSEKNATVELSVLVVEKTKGTEPVIPQPQRVIDSARGGSIEVKFDHSRCIHSRHCVLLGSDVFVANKPGEWIYPDASDPDRLAGVAENCPSGAITYKRLDGKPDELPPKINVVRIRENGPLAIHADLEIDGHASSMRATLCRCGQSTNKPFCDGSHTQHGFVATGEPETRPSEPLNARGGKLQVTPLRNGPLELFGSLEICAGTGRTVDRIATARLCRCGQSSNKPFCDGSHLVAGFEAAGK